MKLLSIFLASSSFADAVDEASDKWVGYDYGSYGGYDSYDTGMAGKFIHEDQENMPSGRMGNGLTCFTCHGRLRMGSTESVTNNAWAMCAQMGGVGPLGVPGGQAADEECEGDQRSCLTEERRRYDITVEVKTGCKNPEACMYQWRRNERYTLPFHLFADQTEAGAPMFFNDECDNQPTGMKFPNGQRAQWESTCRHCCKAALMGSTSCNGPEMAGAMGGPMGEQCGNTGDITCSAAQDSSFKFGDGTTTYGYCIKFISDFVDTLLSHSRAHPGDGRNSLPEDKFVNRMDANGDVLMEQADRLSTEDVDFHNNRAALAGTHGAFGSR